MLNKKGHKKITILTLTFLDAFLTRTMPSASVACQQSINQMAMPNSQTVDTLIRFLFIGE